MEERLGEMRKGRRERIEKGSHCFFKSRGYDKLELKHQNLVFFKLIECIIQKKICQRGRIEKGSRERIEIERKESKGIELTI